MSTFHYTIHLEKEMAAHSSILAWKILWTEEIGGYSPWSCKESDTTEHDYHTHTHTHTHYSLFLCIYLKFFTIKFF